MAIRGALRPLAVAAALALGGACGQPRPWPVRLVVSLHGARGRPVHGIDVTVALPAGSRVAHEAATGRIAREALSLRSGAGGATADGTFAPHATTPSIRLLLASRSPMRDGELLAVEATVTSIATPDRGRFEVARAAIAGPDGASVAGATGWVSAVEAR